MTLFFIALTVLFLWVSFSLSRTSAMIPQVVLTVTLVFLLVQFVLDRRNPRPVRQGVRDGGVLMAIAWISALPAACFLFGVPVSAGLFCLLWMRWQAGERWQISIVFALLLGISVQALFRLLLQADLYQGLLFQFFN
jgi:ABC-type transport system involved in cytochrome c biogenesis permease subunit